LVTICSNPSPELLENASGGGCGGIEVKFFPSWQEPNREFADDMSLEFTYVI